MSPTCGPDRPAINRWGRGVPLHRVAYTVAFVPLLLLAACQSNPNLLESLLPPATDTKEESMAKLDAMTKVPMPPPKAPVQAAQCVKDFWSNCTPVSEKRHAYRWRYIRPGQRPDPGGGQEAGPRPIPRPEPQISR